jgi:electron transport complex protein RnfG
MAKKESTFKNMVLSLVVVTLVASTALAYVYELTKEPIEAARLAKKIRAIDEVVPDYDNLPVEEMYYGHTADGLDSLEIYPAKNGYALAGSAVRSYSGKGYAGNIWLMVGFSPEGNIENISVLEHKETPGLGTKMAEEKFLSQFRGKNPSEYSLKVTKDGGQVDALTGATITSRAFLEATQKAYDTYLKGIQE